MARKTFTNFEIDTNPEVRELINKLISGNIDEEHIINEWIKINKVLYVGWNEKHRKLHVATRISDLKNEHIFRFVANNLFDRLEGSAGEPKFDKKNGSELNIKYVGSSQCMVASWKVNPKNKKAHA